MYNIEEKMDNKAKKFDLLFLRHFFEKKNECGGEHIFLLAHLSTKCSSWAFVMAHCLSSVRASTISLNNFSSETTHWILTKLYRNDPWVIL